MKKLLIIQLDEAYFLYETLQVLEKNFQVLQNYQLTFLVDPTSQGIACEDVVPLFKGMTTNKEEVLKDQYDISVNLSMNESSWDFHGNVSATKKLGPYIEEGTLKIPDLWSTHLLTLKARAPFLTFHLQNIYQNILGFKKVSLPSEATQTITTIALGASDPGMLNLVEQTELIKSIQDHYPKMTFKNAMELDLVTDLSHVLYVGPATLGAIKICENGAKGIFLSRQFNGFNLVPYEGQHYLVSSQGQPLQGKKVYPLVDHAITNTGNLKSFSYPLYETSHEESFGIHLKNLNISDNQYPIYQTHLILWNFILNLLEVNFDIPQCTPGQISLLKTNHDVLTKVIRLHEYAVSSVDTIYHEAKNPESKSAIIEGHLKNLREMESLEDKISVSHPFLRPILDFYRMRKGQNFGHTLLEQAENSFLTYSEEHHALVALQELFSVTLKRNEVNL